MSAGRTGEPGRRRALQQIGRQMGSLVLLLGAQDLAFGAGIVAVRTWPARVHEGQVQIQLEAADSHG